MDNMKINVNTLNSGSKNTQNPLLIYNNNNQEEDDYIENDDQKGNFTNINMIPRTIDDLTRKENKLFSYLNRNLLIIISLLFFDSLLKENCIAYCSYHISKNKQEDDYMFETKYFCGLISGSYLLEIFSLFFIFPLYKINKIIKKLLVILMTATIIVMVPLSLNIGLLAYFIIISFIFLLTSIIEVVSSCYLAYLTPPNHKFYHMNAGSLPLYVMTFGKLCGCLICLTSFTDNFGGENPIKKYILKNLNHLIILVLTFI